MDRSVGSPRTRSVVGVRGLEVSVFGLPDLTSVMWELDTYMYIYDFTKIQNCFHQTVAERSGFFSCT